MLSPMVTLEALAMVAATTQDDREKATQGKKREEDSIARECASHSIKALLRS